MPAALRRRGKDAVESERRTQSSVPEGPPRSAAVVLAPHQRNEWFAANKQFRMPGLALPTKLANVRFSNTREAGMGTETFKRGGADTASGWSRALEKPQMQMLVFRCTAAVAMGDSAQHAVHGGRRPFGFVAVRWPRPAGMTRLTRRPLPSDRRPMPSCL